MTKYISGLHNRIRRDVVLFEVKAVDEACKKSMYTGTKHVKKSIGAGGTFKIEGMKTQGEKGKE